MSQNEKGSGNYSASHLTSKTTFGVMCKFEPIKDDRLIKVEPFLEACSELTHSLDKFGSCFTLPKKDMLGNIKKISNRHKENPQLYMTVNAILEADSEAKKRPSDSSFGVLWLKRALEFLRAFLLGLSQDHHNHVQEENLRQTVLKAYEVSLKQYHGTMTQFIFSNIARLVPYRRDFLKALMLENDATADMVISDIDLYLANFSACVDLLEQLLNHSGLNLQEKV